MACWQSVDRGPIAVEIARRAPGASVLVQVNVTDEAQKGGCRPEEAEALVRQCRNLGLQADGLMAVGPGGPAEAARAAVLASFACVDQVCLFEEDTPEALIEALRPDVLILDPLP